MLIKNARITSSRGLVEADILIEDEKIIRIAKNLKTGEDVLNAKGLIVMPGVVDAHVHVRDFNEAKKEDFTSASRAALSGGVTTFLEMPNTNPSIDSLDVLKKRINLGERKSLVDFGIHMGCPEDVLIPSGMDLPSVKLYMDKLGADVESFMKKVFMLPYPLSLHCEDPRIIKRNEGFAAVGSDFLIHADIRENEAETLAVEMVSRLAFELKKKIHICHVTLAKSVSLVNKFMTCEVTPHHLLITEKDLRELKGIAKTNPPVRSKLDVYGLWNAVKAGRVHVIASDHAPHLLDEKMQDPFDCPSGIPNLDVMLRLMLDLVNRKALRLQDLVRMMCENPSRIFNVRGKGFLRPGAFADILLVDMKAHSKIDTSSFHSKAKYSPFAGRKTVGNVKTVVLRGRVAFEDGEFIVSPGYGRYLYRQL